MADMTEGHLGLKKFNGTTDVKEFIKRYNIAAAAKELTADQKAAWIPVYLTGPAMAFYDTLTVDKTKPDLVMKAIEDQFKGLENSHLQLQRLHQMRQREGESIPKGDELP